MKIVWIKSMDVEPEGVPIGQTEDERLSCGERVAVPEGEKWTVADVKLLVAFLAAETDMNKNSKPGIAIVYVDGVYAIRFSKDTRITESELQSLGVELAFANGRHWKTSERT